MLQVLEPTINSEIRRDRVIKTQEIIQSSQKEFGNCSAFKMKPHYLFNTSFWITNTNIMMPTGKESI
jgi:hypothetical protein